MSFYAELLASTTEARGALVNTPFIRSALSGGLSRAGYLAFLQQAYHHVKHTLPLLMACGASLGPEQAWMRTAIAEYIAEESGHEIWILDDITAAGGDADLVGKSSPLLATELMVAYAYDTIQRGNPVGFFGMVLVLEGTSVAVASAAAGALQQSLALPPEALTYLTSHGDLDQGHVRFFEQLMDQLDNPVDQAAVSHCAGVFYRLYRGIFEALPSGVE
ncbi:MAG: iron-containing redox enzyme family protein [Gammaproteobacteria bacterium]|nr:iron-containing redox enzyme family protein [Gammaproteobacteria bacterium]